MLDVTYSSLLKPLRGILSSEQQEESNNTKHCSRLNLRNLWSCQRLFISPEYRTRCNKAHHPLPGEWVFLEATQRHGDGTSVRGEDAILSITRCVSVTFNLAQELLTFPWSTRWGIWYLRFRRAIPPIERIVPAEWAGTMNRVNHFRVFNYSVHVSPNRPTVYSDLRDRFSPPFIPGFMQSLLSIGRPGLRVLLLGFTFDWRTRRGAGGELCWSEIWLRAPDYTSLRVYFTAKNGGNWSLFVPMNRQAAK